MATLKRPYTEISGGPITPDPRNWQERLELYHDPHGHQTYMQQRKESFDRDVAVLNASIRDGTYLQKIKDHNAQIAAMTRYPVSTHTGYHAVPHLSPTLSAFSNSAVEVSRSEHRTFATPIANPTTQPAFSAPTAPASGLSAECQARLKLKEVKSHVWNLPVSIMRDLLFQAIDKHPDVASTVEDLMKKARSQLHPQHMLLPPSTATHPGPALVASPSIGTTTIECLSPPAQIPTPPVRILSPKIIRAPIKPASKKRKGNAANADGSIDFEKQTDKIHHTLFVKYEKWSCTRQRNVACKAFDAVNEEIANIRARVVRECPFATKKNAILSLTLIADWLSDMPGSMLARELRREFLESEPMLFDSLDWCANCLLPDEARQVLDAKEGEGWVDWMDAVMKQMKDYLMDEQERLQAVIFKVKVRARVGLDGYCIGQY